MWDDKKSDKNEQNPLLEGPLPWKGEKAVLAEGTALPLLAI